MKLFVVTCATLLIFDECLRRYSRRRGDATQHVHPIRRGAKTGARLNSIVWCRYEEQDHSSASKMLERVLVHYTHEKEEYMDLASYRGRNRKPLFFDAAARQLPFTSLGAPYYLTVIRLLAESRLNRTSLLRQRTINKSLFSVARGLVAETAVNDAELGGYEARERELPRSLRNDIAAIQAHAHYW